MSLKYCQGVLNFKDPATVYAHSLMSVHHDAMGYLIMILVLVYGSLFKIIKDFNWSVFNKQMGSSLVLFSPVFFSIEYYFFWLYVRGVLKLIQGYVHFLQWVLAFVVDKHLDPVQYTEPVWRGFDGIILKFYQFQTGVEHMLGYSAKVSPFALGLDAASSTPFEEHVGSMLIEKYMDFFLFNRFNMAYYYHNASNLKLFLSNQRFDHSTNFEVVCASLPTVIILLILVPSTLLLYSLDEELEPLVTYKVVGHQGFGSYEFSNGLQLSSEGKKMAYNFDSCMVTEDELEYGSKRLLEVDKPLFVPVNVPVRFLITSADVLHSGALPELGVKIDAVPGRLSHYLVLIRRPGFFFGQCSELCGVAHGFMPIVLKVL